MGLSNYTGNLSQNFSSPNLEASPMAENYEQVQHAVEYGNGMEQAARKFQGMIIGLWAINTALIFTHRLLTREKPISIEILGETIWELEHDLTDRQEKLVEHADNILFTVNYTLLSFLLALQFMPYGKVTTGGT
jgi:hypothetical protein